MTPPPIDLLKWWQHAWINRLQSLLLLVIMAVFFAALGWLLWGRDGLVTLLSMGLITAMLNTLISPQLVMSLYGARPIIPKQMPALYEAVNLLAARAELNQPPKLYYIPSEVLNAFAVGRPAGSAVAITDGLLKTLSFDELLAVLAHEISHIRNNDLWIMGLADMFSRTTRLLSLIGQLLLWVNLPLLLIGAVTINWLAILLLLLAPNLSALAQLSLSRTREYHADLNAVLLMGDADALASALMKIEQYQGDWMEQLFMPGYKVPVPSILRTHPPTEDRVRRIMALKADLQAGQWLPEQLKAVKMLASENIKPPRWHASGLWY
jgi:heat shock protein HtpX